jgi:hypothetical protein
LPPLRLLLRQPTSEKSTVDTIAPHVLYTVDDQLSRLRLLGFFDVERSVGYSTYNDQACAIAVRA